MKRKETSKQPTAHSTHTTFTSHNSPIESPFLSIPQSISSCEKNIMIHDWEGKLDVKKIDKSQEMRRSGGKERE